MKLGKWTVLIWHFSSLFDHSKCFYTTCHIHLFTHWWHREPTGSSHSHTFIYHWCSHREQFGVKCLAQGHIDSRSQESNCRSLVDGRSTSWATAAQHGCKSCPHKINIQPSYWEATIYRRPWRTVIYHQHSDCGTTRLCPLIFTVAHCTSDCVSLKDTWITVKLW